MSLKTLIIHNSPILFEIFEEIKENLNFDIIKFNEKKMDQSYLNNFENYVIISKHENSIKNCNVLSIPSNIDKILEQINIWFLGSKFSSQSKIKIGDYFLNLNSRQISKTGNILNLTEKETELILFIKTNKFVTLKDLEKKVWKHSSELETHTVETHVYRLRKKFLKSFKDEKFIKHDKKGYYLH